MATTITEILGNAGAPLTFTCEGKKYPVYKLAQKTKAAFEQFLHDNANAVDDGILRAAMRAVTAAQRRLNDVLAKKKSLQPENGELTDELKMAIADLAAEQVQAESALNEENTMLAEAREGRKQTKDAIAVGEYRFGGKLFERSLETPTGGAKLAAVLMNISDEEAMNLFMIDGEGLRAVLDEAIRQSVPKVYLERLDAMRANAN